MRNDEFKPLRNSLSYIYANLDEWLKNECADKTYEEVTTRVAQDCANIIIISTLKKPEEDGEHCQ